jgi:hypothetical protein
MDNGLPSDFALDRMAAKIDADDRFPRRTETVSAERALPNDCFGKRCGGQTGTLPRTHAKTGTDKDPLHAGTLSV